MRPTYVKWLLGQIIKTYVKRDLHMSKRDLQIWNETYIYEMTLGTTNQDIHERDLHISKRDLQIWNETYIYEMTLGTTNQVARAMSQCHTYGFSFERLIKTYLKRDLHISKETFKYEMRYTYMKWLFGQSSHTCHVYYMCNVTHSYVEGNMVESWYMWCAQQTHSYVWHDSCIRATWPNRTCDVTQSYVEGNMIESRYTRCVRQTQSYVRHDSFIRAMWLVHIGKATWLSQDTRDVRGRLNHMCVVWSCIWTNQITRCLPECDMARSYVRHDSFICTTWPVNMCDVPSHVCGPTYERVKSHAFVREHRFWKKDIRGTIWKKDICVYFEKKTCMGRYERVKSHAFVREHCWMIPCQPGKQISIRWQWLEKSLGGFPSNDTN